MAKINTPSLKIIAAADALMNNPQLGFAAEIMMPIQQFKAKNGDTYELSVRVKFVKKKGLVK